MTADVMDKPATHSFQAEVSRLLNLMVHSVYSNKDIFLRELVSNAADACEKLRFTAVEKPDLLGDDPDLRITIELAADTLTIADNGIGMTAAELIDNLGTIAKSGTKAFLDAMGEGKSDASRLIGQFGVGFYSAFMVADKVAVTSRAAGAGEANLWVSDGKGAFTVEPIALDAAPARGTRICLHLKPDALDYARKPTVEKIIQTYSAHVPVPIVIVTPAEGDAPATTENLTDGAALWTRPKSEISKEAYTEFYGTVSGQWDEPAVTLHYRAEGRTEYTVLAFVPTMKPFDLFDPARKGRIKLYVRRVFISDEAELLPAWLRFVRGVIDSEDLPLNLSREMLQSNPILEAIRKGVTSKVLSELAKLADNDAETFLKVWESFGAVIKEGLYEDADRRDDLFKLVRFRTTRSGDGWRSLADYIKDLRENQTRIFYVLGETQDKAKASPHLEGFRARDVEVLLLSDPVDAFWVRTALGFDGKPFQSITQGAADLDLIPRKDADQAPKEEAEAKLGASHLVDLIKAELGDSIADARISSRLAESPVCLVAPDFGPDKELERILGKHQGGAASRPILEVNPTHPLIAALAARLDSLDADAKADAAQLLYGQARILDGEAPDNPADFARRLGRLMQNAFG
ncbi:MAG: molecular chaperone HtpG [Hyphomicrobiaceae bacterium]|nr:molecular chaperone HtpG [Hyphomicrobiaceae bacterium]